MTELALPMEQVYGARELKKKAHKFVSWALAISSCVHFLILGVYWGSIYLASDEAPMTTIRIMKYSELGPPPSISGLNETVAPAVSVANPAVKPSIGIPVPVPDAEVSPEQQFLSQQELSQMGADVGGTGEGQGLQIQEDVKVENIEEEGPPPDYVPVEKAPEIVKIIKPVYPEIARKSGMEGTVWVKAWLTKEGKVKEVQIVKSSAEIFNQAALDAAQQFLFTPAIAAGGPVQVWVTWPFNFKLNE